MNAARCLITMAKEEPNASLSLSSARQCDDGRPVSVVVSEEEGNNDSIIVTATTVSPSNSCDATAMTHGQYSCDNMIPSAALPDPNEWDREKISSVQW